MISFYLNIACLDFFFYINNLWKKHLSEPELQLSSKSQCYLILWLAKTNLLLEWCGNFCMLRCCRFSYPSQTISLQYWYLKVPSIMPFEIMHSIDFLLLFLCCAEYFSFRIIYEAVLTVYILDLILLEKGLVLIYAWFCSPSLSPSPSPKKINGCKDFALWLCICLQLITFGY